MKYAQEQDAGRRGAGLGALGALGSGLLGGGFDGSVELGGGGGHTTL